MGISKIFSEQAYSRYGRQLKREVLAGPMPRHVAIIMDGNRRYAAEIMDARAEAGHKKGEEKIEEMLDWCLDLKIPYITVYAFSTENFNRDRDEVDFLMALSESALYRMADNPKIHENKVRIRILGEHETLPEDVREAVRYAEEKTAAYAEYNFNVAMAYGSRQEILSAVKEIASKVKDGSVDIDSISEEMFSSHLYTSDIPDPDLVLRTSGEVRISNFLLWQLAYSELYFTDVYWPGFRYIDLLRAVRSYQQRIRRYGR
ncbi:MAG: di-trans,poly-cis-decaprenylcistransferase [Candidatus Methanoplasma sp.]|jgi:tritrans,polycis-undecaprenyl-diphosphate synthase [geranylgeranyl-diphosphate specific]|nr:di-trans,poly-cis-decaprenylcistransferase [Candidatus Methanoplasma sp.]